MSKGKTTNKTTGKSTQTQTKDGRNIVKSDTGTRSKTASDAKGTGGLGAGKKDTKE